MSTDREMDAFADAVLVAILRYLVANGQVEGDEPYDGVLTPAGVEVVDEMVRNTQALGLLNAGQGPDAEGSMAYRKARRAIDPLWRYVERYGLAALAFEAGRRTEEPTAGRDDDPRRV